jgi:prepilin-type N-terminal cleavage/methylation domain-containing protein
MMPTRRDDSTGYRHPEAGFSLVEVMAALVILSIALTAVFATFISQQKSFTVQNRVAEMQQNLRQAVEYTSRDIRMAGYGIPADVIIPNGLIATGVISIRSIYAKDNTTGPDQIFILYLFDMDANQPPTTDNALGVPVNAGSITVPSTAGFLATGRELVLITDGTAADLYETSNAAGTTLTFGGGYSYNAGHSKSYPAGSPPVTVAKARFVRYYIDNTTDPAHPTLMVDRMGGATPQPLADDIEDMQFEYGLDTSTPSNGVVDIWIPNPTLTQLTQVRQVRLRFIARTRLPESGWSETRPALSNRAAGTTPDGYRRRIYDIVIDVRNSGV